jgi:ATP-dependent exoDNAse (exonuclease V) alpha subunit
MAIYHFHAKMVHRAKGQSAVAGAAYRSGSRLYETSTGITHDYTHKGGVEHSEILAPADAPAWVFDRHTLWNTVEASEKRKDAQVAREIEVGLPIELKDREQVALLRDFVNREFVTKGMVADIGIHRDNPNNPHSHILLTTRDLTPEGFGPEEPQLEHHPTTPQLAPRLGRSHQRTPDRSRPRCPHRSPLLP